MVDPGFSEEGLNWETSGLEGPKFKNRSRVLEWGGKNPSPSNWVWGKFPKRGPYAMPSRSMEDFLAFYLF